MPEFANPAHVSVTGRGGGDIPLGPLVAGAAVIGAGAFVLANLVVIAALLAVTGVVIVAAVTGLKRHAVVGWAPAGMVMAPRRAAIAPQVHVHFHGLSVQEAAQVLALDDLALDDLARRALEAP